MESKKINQLATELAPDLSDLTIIGDPTTGISKKITLSQMASLFTGTVEEYANFAAFPLVGVADTIYVAKDTNVIYRWDSTAYVVLSPNVIASLVFNDANGFDGNIALVGSVATLTITTALTTGSVGFIGASGALLQDNANFFWDDTNNRLGINTNAPTTALDVFGSGIIGRINATSTNNAYLGFASAGTNKWSVGNVQSDHRFRIFSEANSAELITILQTGEFGIGIANPLTKLHIDGGATALIANLDANVSVAKSISFRSDNSNRINLEVSGTESGSNAGMDFFLRAYTDAGSLLATHLTITRSTGLATFSGLIRSNAATGFAVGSISAYRRIEYTGTTFSLLTDADAFADLSAGIATFSGQVQGTIINSTSNAFRFSGNTALSLVTLNSQSVVKINAAGYWGVVLVGANDQGLIINNSGLVGIGTATPNASYRLTLSAASTSSAVVAGLAIVDTEGTTYSIFSGGNNLVIRDVTNTTSRITLASTGYVTFEGAGSGWTIGNGPNLIRIDYTSASFRCINAANGFTPIAASAFNVNSDYRLKEDLKDFNNSLSIIDSIKIYDFKWKDRDERNYGVIAHELQEVLPYIVYGEKDAFNENEEMITQGVDYGKLVPILIKAIQELKSEIDLLKAK